MYGEQNAPDQGGGYGGGDAIGAAINVGGMLYDSYQNRKASKQNNERTISANKSEAELAYQRSIEEWNRQNLYNSPEAQMARFKAAGLNPNLIYGQGNAGNASSPPSYQPANVQHRVAAPAYGAAIQSAMPTLMQVGSWVQNMRMGQAQIKKTQTETQRSEQMVDFLTKQNPLSLEQRENQLSLYPYQSQMLASQTEQANAKLKEMSTEYRYKYGDDLWKVSNIPGAGGEIGGVKKLQYLQEQSKMKLLEAKSSWADFDITDPQQIMMMVLNGVMGMAGAAIRKPASMPSGIRKGSRPVERPRGLVRRRMGPNHPDR